MAKKRTTPEQREEIIRFINNGLYAEEIAKAVGVSIQAVYSISAYYSIPINKKPGQQRAQTIQSSEICPKQDELVHCSGDGVRPGFDLLPEDAKRLREIRFGVYYSLHPECESIDSTNY